MSTGCKLISFGKINKYILLVLSAAIFKTGESILKKYTKFSSEIRIKIIDLNNIFIVFFYSLGLLLSIILYFIYNIYNKTEKAKIKSTIKYKQKETVSKLKKFLWIILISVIDFISKVYESFLNFQDREELILQIPTSWIMNIIFMSFYSFIIS